MPVDFDRVAEVSRSVADVYGAAELRLVRLVTDRLAADLDATDWATRKLSQVTGLRVAAQHVADRVAADGDRAVRQVVADGYRAGNDSAPLDLARHLGHHTVTGRAAGARGGSALQALADAAAAELRPLHAAILPQTEAVYRRAVAGATARRLAGVQDLRHAAQAAWAALADRGVVRFVDSSGRHWQLSTYVEMAVRTAVARATVTGQIDGWTSVGIEHCYVVDNPRECPLCYPWETQILSLGDHVIAPALATLHEAMAAGLLHPGCRHRLRPWRPGVRVLAARRPEGPTGYDAEQRQRALERGLRAWRTRRAAAFTPEAARAADAKVAAWTFALSEHLEAHPRLARKRHRERPGAGFVAPAHRRDDHAVLPH